MDVSNVDPETVLVDWKNVEPSDPDASGEIDPNVLRDFGQEDKVMVSIRYSKHQSYPLVQFS